MSFALAHPTMTFPPDQLPFLENSTPRPFVRQTLVQNRWDMQVVFDYDYNVAEVVSCRMIDWQPFVPEQRKRQMRVRDIDQFFAENALPPSEEDQKRFEEWLAMPEVWQFLANSAEHDVPVLAVNNRIYLEAVFVSQRKLGKRYVPDLLKWNFGASIGWGYGSRWNPNTGEEVGTIFPPLDSTGTRILESAEPVVFLRDIYESSDSHYLELNQRFAHVVGIHRMESRNAYCRVDENGDLEAVATMRAKPSNILCTVARDALDFYMFLTDSVLVRVFEVNHYRNAPSISRKNRGKIRHDVERDIHARWVVFDPGSANAASYIRGFQVIRNKQPHGDMLNRVRGVQSLRSNYATFLAYDFKHVELKECSCAPDQLGNYFEPSDLPFELSPAFFKPDVLLKYKQDPDKYIIRSRSVTCRGAWHLDYDVNDEGQLHAYLIDLSRLPYSEQLYWKSFNVVPITGISERAYRTEFLGEWFGTDEPLDALKRRLVEFPLAVQRGREIAIWEAGEDAKMRDFPRLSYVRTESSKEWEDQVLELNKVLVEGFSKASLRQVAKAAGIDDKTIALLGSLKLLRLCLEKRGIEEEIIDGCVTPLQELNGLRSSQGVAHVGSRPRDQDLRFHYRSLVERCDRAMETLAELVQVGTFNVP